MKPEEYFPRKPGEEPFLPPFTNAVKPKNAEGKVVPRICAKCEDELGTVKAVGGDKSEGLCPKCGQGWFWESEPTKPGEKK